MKERKAKTVHSYKVGMKQVTKTVKAERVTYGTGGEVKFHLGSELVFVAAPQKWDYVQREEAVDERST